MNKRILIAMDDSDSSEFVFEQAFLIAQEHKSSLKLLHVLNSQDQIYLPTRHLVTNYNLLRKIQM